MVRETGIAVAVGGSPEADFDPRNQGEVGAFLALLAGILPTVEKPCRTANEGKVLDHDE